MDSAWGNSRKQNNADLSSVSVSGTGTPGGSGSKLVQLQRQSSALSGGLPTLSTNSFSSISSGPLSSTSSFNNNHHKSTSSSHLHQHHHGAGAIHPGLSAFLTDPSSATESPVSDGYNNANYHNDSNNNSSSIHNNYNYGASRDGDYGMANGSIGNLRSSGRIGSGFGGFSNSAAFGSQSSNNGSRNSEIENSGGTASRGGEGGGGGGGDGTVSGSGSEGQSSAALSYSHSTALTGSVGGSSEIHPLHFNWVFWFMHRSPGSKILNYESAMKKIATFGSIEDFWAVYSHLRRPHELPHVSDYHLFKQGVRPVWEDETNIHGGKWIVRLKKGLASRYWENLVMAVVGDQFEVGSEVCGIVLSIRGAEDILSIWNQSAQEGRINLKIRDTMKKVLDLPADTVMEYKTHNDALKDNTSFRNTDVFR
ncbi:Eukaryotic translation initiation factor 4E type 2 [Mortierella claussenii]|nr:Eukaryotic translation initiation factor 4E type 2 [Mortierella claussenii]